MTCRQQTSPLTPAPVVPNQAEPIASRPTQPASASADYRNEGQATPLATLQTFAWACDHGETATIVKLLYFDKEAREKAAAFMASLPEHTRAQWKSPEEMAATYFAATQIDSPYPDASILQTATIAPTSETRVTLRLPGTLKDNSQYQKTGDIWQLVVTETMIHNYLNRISQTSINH